MADATLLGLVAARLKAHAPTGPTGDLVLAAFQGRPAIEAGLAGERVAAPSTADVEARTRPAAAYLTAIEVEGFRGVGETATLAIGPGPGLTLVVGRNGSGKSSFSEAL